MQKARGKQLSPLLQERPQGNRTRKTNYSETPHQLSFPPPVPTAFSLVLARQEGANVTLARWQQVIFVEETPSFGLSKNGSCCQRDVRE